MVAITLALGSLFSLGVVLVNQVLGASNAEFGVLIALFGVGAGIGLVVMQKRRGERSLQELKVSVSVLGAMVFVTVLAPSLPLAYGGAVGFGAAASFSLAAGMSLLQTNLVGEERVVAFAAFHILIRVGLGLGAAGAGVAGQLLSSPDIPFVGRTSSTRIVLFFAGLFVLASSSLVGSGRGGDPQQTKTGRFPVHPRGDMTERDRRCGKRET